jgi:hypothetical protein
MGSGLDIGHFPPIPGAWHAYICASRSDAKAPAPSSARRCQATYHLNEPGNLRVATSLHPRLLATSVQCPDPKDFASRDKCPMSMSDNLRMATSLRTRLTATSVQCPGLTPNVQCPGLTPLGFDPIGVCGFGRR